MLPFVYYTPTRVVFGKDAQLQVGQLIASYGYRKIMLHYGGGSIHKTGLYSQVMQSLHQAGIEVIELGGVQPNPTLPMVKQGVALCKQHQIELVLAVGGGSVIDSAKAIANGALADFDPWLFFTKEKTPQKALPVGVILTLAASGSEMSSSCVITNEEQQLKRGFNADTNRPLFALCNPELTYTVDKYQTACGITDIMMHTLERFFSDAPPTPLTDRIALALLRSVVEAGTVAVNQPNDYNARATLMWAGSLAHNDLTSSGRKGFLAVHQLAHEVNGLFDQIAHGAALAILWPAWAKRVLPMAPQRFAQYAQAVWDVTPDAQHPEQAGLAGIEHTQRFFHSIGMPSSLAEVGVMPDRFEEMAEKCTFSGKRMIDGILPLDKQRILEIFELAR